MIEKTVPKSLFRNSFLFFLLNLNYFYFPFEAATLSANFFPTLNLTTFLAAILISFPVWGFLPFLAALFWTPKVPQPTNWTLFPLVNDFSTVPKNSFTNSSALFLVSPVAFA